MRNDKPSGGGLPPLPDATSPVPDATLAVQPLQPDATGTPQPLLPAPSLAFPWFNLRSLRCGCYLVNYTPSKSVLLSYDGTLRVECHNQGRTVSGDLYQRRLVVLPPTLGFPISLPRILLGAAPNPAAGIPIFPRAQYRYYLRVTQVLEYFTFSNKFTLGFEMYRFTTPNNWSNEGAFTAEMSWIPAPAGYPSPGDFLAGDVRNAAGAVVGRLTMGWVSSRLRRAVIEVDRVSVSEAPLHNGAGIDWQDIFDTVHWQISVDASDANVFEPSGESWSDAEMHQAMLARRDASNLDAEWRYHVLCVRRLDSTSRGIMYDAAATDSNNVPREGAGISSHWTIPNADPWGLVKGVRFGAATAPYFRTAVHEIGHALGLYHNTVDNGVMNTTDVIAASGTSASPFPNNIQWSFAPDDAKKLRHYPDIFVRPGGTAFGGASPFTPPITPTDLQVAAEALELRVLQLLEAVPIGAPVRATLELINLSDQPQIVPESIGLRSGFVSGAVVDPTGTTRTFLPLVHCIEDNPFRVLQPGESLTHSVTLLRGGQGALFPASGSHRITVDVRWPAGEAEVTVSGSTTIMVTAAVDEAHARAANVVLSTPDTLLILVLGGDHIDEGIAAIRTALSNPVLRPHFAYIEAKRLATRFGRRRPQWDQVDDLLRDATIMSPAEVRKARKLVAAAGESASVKSIARTLDERATQRPAAGTVPPAGISARTTAPSTPRTPARTRRSRRTGTGSKSGDR